MCSVKVRDGGKGVVRGKEGDGGRREMEGEGRAGGREREGGREEREGQRGGREDGGEGEGGGGEGGRDREREGGGGGERARGRSVHELNQNTQEVKIYMIYDKRTGRR